MPNKNYLPGGILMCVFSLIFYYALHDSLGLPWLVFLALLFFCGVWTVILSAFRLDTDGAFFWLGGAIVALGLAVFAFLMAWHEVDGWSGGIPFIPAAWNQIVARILFALGGLVALLSAVVFSLIAYKRLRKKPDDET